MTESLNRHLNRTKFACEAMAKQCRRRAAATVDTLVRAALSGFARQLDDRAAQIDVWLNELPDGVSPEREAELSAACAEWLRMMQ